MHPIPYGRQFISEEDIESVIRVLRSDLLTQGPEIDAFEKAFSEYIGSKFAVAVANGTAALHLAGLSLNINESSNVITTPITFAATANCVKYCNGNVFFADIDPKTYLLDLNKVEDLLKSKPKSFFTGIIPVDFAGRAINLEDCRKLADKYGLWIIEDACHAPGGYFSDSKGNRQKCGNGNYADLAIFSFHPVKHIACGEGGMITTNNEKLYKRLLLLRTHGITKDVKLLHKNDGGWYYEMQDLGYNYRLTDFQAALGNSQLKRADDGLTKRKLIADSYFKAFQENLSIHGQSAVFEGHAYHLYIIEVRDRLGLFNYLRHNKIFAQVHYIPVHTLPYYQNLGWKKGDFPFAEKFYEHCLSIPMYPTLTNVEQEYIINKVNSFLNK